MLLTTTFSAVFVARNETIKDVIAKSFKGQAFIYETALIKSGITQYSKLYNGQFWRTILPMPNTHP